MDADFIGDRMTGVAVTISSDGMSAYIQLVDPECAQEITEGVLEDLLRASGVTYGIQREALAAFAGDPMAYVNRPLLVAKGDPPVNGRDGYIRNLFAVDDSAPRPAIKDDGRVDFRDINRLNNVTKGQLIAERIPATKGTDGITVTGETVPGKDGKEARFKVGKNVVLDEEKMRLYAVIDGLVTETDRGKINVFPVYEVNGDVDYRVGNIDFVGNVVVRGNVLSGFKIKAAGDIRITGGVEAAELEAEGSIDIASGIFAGGKGYVKAGVNVKSSFMQEANVFAGEDVIVSQSILHSNVRAGKRVICQGSKGLIVGGLIQAGELVSARTIGNTMSTATAIEVGVAPEMRNELVELRTKMRAISEGLKKTEQALHLLDQMAASGTITPEKEAMRAKLLATRNNSAAELAAIKERILEIESSLEEVEKAKVIVTGTIYAGTKVVIGRYTRFIKDATRHAAFQLQGGEIVMTSDI